MRDYVLLKGMILETSPIRDYDRRLVILTKERGKITAFANGVRKPNSKLLAATNPFCFGNFKLYEGKNSYTVADIEPENYFEPLRDDFEGAFLGMYFLEFASYYCRENNDESEMLKLLYQSIRAIIKDTIDNRLVRCIFEIKALVINGEFPGIPKGAGLSSATEYTINYICASTIGKLYTFTVSDMVLEELKDFSEQTRRKYVDHYFKSLETIDML